MTIKLILNPYANRWGAKRRVSQVKQALREAGLEYDLHITTRPKEGTEVAKQAAASGQYSAVIAAGGDGTVNEVVNGLIGAAAVGQPTIPLGVLPIGTGNDFNDMAGLPRQLGMSVAIIAAGRTRQVDAGQVNDHYFDNNCAVAMEPMVTIENVKMTRLSGNIRYIAALVKALLKLKAWQMEITWDEGRYSGPTFLLSVCNGPRNGGQFYMSPTARMDDGLFDFVLLPEVSKKTVLALLPRLFKGTHIHHPQVIHGRSQRITIHSIPGTPIHADGEVLTEAADNVTYQILPGKITLLS
ncbi:MAG: diacylglycerol kinase family lipid kinase [Anaerolineae bacterium]|nr:diacylglycerol kinase family lipid kinase [Anaerolineae bacterium]